MICSGISSQMTDFKISRLSGVGHKGGVSLSLTHYEPCVQKRKSKTLLYLDTLNSKRTFFHIMRIKLR